MHGDGRDSRRAQPLLLRECAVFGRQTRDTSCCQRAWGPGAVDRPPARIEGQSALTGQPLHSSRGQADQDDQIAGGLELDRAGGGAIARRIAAGEGPFSRNSPRT